MLNDEHVKNELNSFNSNHLMGSSYTIKNKNSLDSSGIRKFSDFNIKSCFLISGSTISEGSV